VAGQRRPKFKTRRVSVGDLDSRKGAVGLSQERIAYGLFVPDPSCVLWDLQCIIVAPSQSFLLRSLQDTVQSSGDSGDQVCVQHFE